MSDYLGNLLVRSIAPVAGVRPRVSARFEPPTLAPIITSTCEPEPEAQEDPFSIVQSAIPSKERPPVASPAAPLPRTDKPAPKRSKREPPQTNKTPAPKSDSGRREMCAELAPPTYHPHDLAKDETNDQPAETIPARPHPPPVRIESLVAKPVEKPVSLHAAPPTGPEHAQEKSRPQPLIPPAKNSVEAQTKTPMRSAVQVQIENEFVERPRIRPVPSQAAAVRPVIPTLNNPVAKPSSSTEAPTPTINVTIGRIEVRAAVAPAPPRAKGRPATVLSLDEYLRNRAQEGRR